MEDLPYMQGKRNRAAYGGYIIDARPFQLVDDNRWSTDITLERHTGAAVETRPFCDTKTWETREEAVRYCWNFGRQIIDGKVNGCQAP